MKIIRIYGGLGNQMFQYALAVTLQQLYPAQTIYIDHSVMNGYKLHNGFELDRIFNTTIKQAPIKAIAKLGYPLVNYYLWQIGRRCLPKRCTMTTEAQSYQYNPDLLADSSDMLYDGYWQCEQYFTRHTDAIRQAFTFPAITADDANYRLSQQLATSTAVSIHVRRGDYLNIPSTAGICTLDYYRNAIDTISGLCRPDLYIVLSDDIDWCRNNIKPLLSGTPVEFVHHNRGCNSYRDMQLMTLCRHNIVSNSSFAWWGAWLNPNPGKIVIAPTKWMVDNEGKNIIPESWLRVTTN